MRKQQHDYWKLEKPPLSKLCFPIGSLHGKIPSNELMDYKKAKSASPKRSIDDKKSTIQMMCDLNKQKSQSNLHNGQRIFESN